MRRVMLKLSGESLMGKNPFGFCDDTCKNIATQIKKAHDENIQICIVLGGGNFYRGRNNEQIDRYKADAVGMLATCMNVLYFSEFLRLEGMETALYGAFSINGIIKQFQKDDVIEDLNNNKIILLSGGTGHPYFTTDSGVALRAIELECDEILMAKSIDYIYDKDPIIYQDAKKIEEISYSEIINKRLGVMDLTSAVLLMENKIPCKLFSGKDFNNISLALLDKVKGTKIYG